MALFYKTFRDVISDNGPYTSDMYSYGPYNGNGNIDPFVAGGDSSNWMYKADEDWMQRKCIAYNANANQWVDNSGNAWDFMDFKVIYVCMNGSGAGGGDTTGGTNAPGDTVPAVILKNGERVRLIGDVDCNKIDEFCIWIRIKSNLEAEKVIVPFAMRSAMHFL